MVAQPVPTYQHSDVHQTPTGPAKQPESFQSTSLIAANFPSSQCARGESESICSLGGISITSEAANQQATVLKKL